MILGIDEVGRGPWAGPLVVGAVVLNGAEIEGLTDSKKLSKSKREYFYQQIMSSSADVGLGWVDSKELDEIGLSQSLVEATKRAVSMITVPYHEIIIDGTVNFLKDTAKGKYVATMKKADLLISSVSAASIIAKVARDEYMVQQAALYPEYGFANHVGYGTARHRAAIDAHGVTPLHRLSFAPLAGYKESTVSKTSITQPTSKSIGDEGESVAVTWLIEQRYRIVARNWKTKLCEIDIVAVKDTVYYFIEVKHRKNVVAGGGIAAITAKKRAQMAFAATIYRHFHSSTSDARLAVITTSVEAGVAAFESYIELE